MPATRTISVSWIMGSKFDELMKFLNSKVEKIILRSEKNEILLHLAQVNYTIVHCGETCSWQFDSCLLHNISRPCKTRSFSNSNMHYFYFPLIHYSPMH